MSNMSVMRARCYLILQGLERSVVENIVRNLEMSDPEFLAAAEAERALNRFREDMQDTGWRLEDVDTGDLLPYLDLGDLLGLLNRHKSAVRNAKPSDIRAATQIIERRGVHAIRNRVMHPARPLEPEDFPTLMSVTEKLRKDASTLWWGPLVESVALISDPTSIADITIPPYWIHEPRIAHNLPVAEFDDTGFIGRREERGRLKNLLRSDHSVITVVGAGGVGKTALALRICYDLLEDATADLDGLIWVSLKTHRLTPDGVRAITDAVDTTGLLIDQITVSAGISADSSPGGIWATVLDYMKANRILLVIDNLETLGTEVRELAVGIPHGSKLLLTSRVGLGEIELRYPIPDLSPRDASQLIPSASPHRCAPSSTRET